MQNNFLGEREREREREKKKKKKRVIQSPHQPPPATRFTLAPSTRYTSTLPRVRRYRHNKGKSLLANDTKERQPYADDKLQSKLVSWCFEPSQPQWVISGLIAIE